MSRDTESPEALQQAWVDGELSTVDALKLEAQLQPEELKRLQAEKTFQSQLLSQLKDTPPCPEPLWEEIKLKMGQTSPHRITPTPSQPWRAFAVAASLCLGLGLLWNLSPQQKQHSSPFAQKIETMERELQKNGFLVNLRTPDPEAYHNIDFISGFLSADGLRAELNYRCCGEDVKILVFKNNVPHITSLPQTQWAHRVERPLGHHRLIAKSQHRPDEVLDLIY
jgi:hypothetical protein